MPSAKLLIEAIPSAPLVNVVIAYAALQYVSYNVNWAPGSGLPSWSTFLSLTLPTIKSGVGVFTNVNVIEWVGLSVLSVNVWSSAPVYPEGTWVSLTQYAWSNSKL